MSQFIFNSSLGKYINEQISRYFQCSPGAPGASIVFLQGNGVPSNLLGQNGNVYIDLTSGNIYQKIDDVWVFIVNLTGDKGDTGDNGLQLLYGNGAPNVTLGVDGDTYLDLLTDDVYVKIGGVWVLETNITGDKGDTGDTGDANVNTAGFSAETVQVPPLVPTDIILVPTNTSSPYYNINNMISITGIIDIDRDGYWYVQSNVRIINTTPREFREMSINFYDSSLNILFSYGQDDLFNDSITDISGSTNLFLTVGQYTFRAFIQALNPVAPAQYPIFHYGVHLFAPAVAP